MELASYIAFAGIVLFIAWKVFQARSKSKSTGTGGQSKFPADHKK